MAQKGFPVNVCLSTEHTTEDGVTERQLIESEGYGWLHTDTWVVRFAEQEQGGDQVMTTVKAQENRLTVIRRGSVTMRQEFDPVSETRGRYHHPYGTMEMVTKTERLHRSELLDGWQVAWSYRLRLNGVEAGTFYINLTIKPTGME